MAISLSFSFAAALVNQQTETPALTRRKASHFSGQHPSSYDPLSFEASAEITPCAPASQGFANV